MSDAKIDFRSNPRLIPDDARLKFGTGNNTELVWSTVDADNHSLVLALGDSNQALHVTDVGAVATDWNVAADTHPALYIHSNTTPATDYLKIGGHDGANATIDLVGGTTLKIAFDGAADIDISATALSPSSDGGNALGTASLGWNGLHLDTGTAINWENGDVTLTHAAGKLTLGGDGAVEFDFADHEMTNVDIDSGAIDGVVIGAVTPAAGAFTTIAAEGDITLTGAAVVFATGVASVGTEYSIQKGVGASMFRNVPTGADHRWSVNAVDKVILSATALDMTGPTTVLMLQGRATNGMRIGADSSNNEIDDSSQGSGSTTLYIGNASINVTSDSRLKENIRPTSINALELLGKMEVRDFEWNDPSDTSLHGKNYRGTYTGMIAQETVKIAPWIINDQGGGRDCDDCMAGRECEWHFEPWQVEYEHLVPTLVKAIQELNSELEALRGVQSAKAA